MTTKYQYVVVHIWPPKQSECWTIMPSICSSLEEAENLVEKWTDREEKAGRSGHRYVVARMHPSLYVDDAEG